MAGATVHPDVHLRFYQAALLERQSNAQLQSLLPGRFSELVDHTCPKVGAQA
jgi:hypothetical protein